MTMALLRVILWAVLMSIAASDRAAADEPAILISEAFDDADLLQRGWYDGQRFRISAEHTFSGTGCLEYAWAERSTTPASSSGIRHLFSPSDSVYVRFRMRLSRGWKWTGREYHPHLMHLMTTENDRYHGPAASRLTAYIEPQDGRLRLALQDIQNKDAPHGLTQGPLRGGYNGAMFDSRERVFSDAEWHTIEAFFQLNTLDTAKDAPRKDGVVRGWFDGVRVVEHNDVVFRSTDYPQMKFNQFLLTPYFGPGLLPQSQTLWIDDLIVATGRPADTQQLSPGRLK